MQDERNAQRFVAAPRKLRACRGRRGGEGFAPHAGEIDAAALEESTVLGYARDSAAALRSLPGVGAERSAVEPLERGDDALLQSGEIIVDRLDVHASPSRA